MGILSENRMFLYMVFFLAFLHLTFDPRMTVAYLLIIVCDYWWYKDDSYVSLPMERTEATRKSAIASTVIYYAVFLFASIVILGMTTVGKEFASIAGVFQLSATAVPILQGSKIFTFISWGFIIPIIETRFFFGRLYEGMAVHAKDFLGYEISTKKLTIATIGLIIFISALFTIFHIGAKGLSTPALMTTFIFAVISLLFVTKTQELKGACGLHIVTNSIGVLKSIGVI